MANLRQGSHVTVDGIPVGIPASSVLRRLSRISAIVLASLLGAGICAAQSQEQSDADRPLATVAREKSVRKAKVVITDEDMPSHPQPAPQISASGRPDAAAAEKDETAKKDESAKQPAAQATPPRSLSQPATLDQAQQRVDELKQQEQMLIRYYDEMQRKLSETESESRRRMYSESLASRDLSLSRKRKQIEEAERALQQIDKAGPPQGGTTDAAK
ncbi:MAG TPA: hypothetical protein VK555_07535 [Terriglobales bacterium]|nr:hypothetical protein [Terriglobales bacterium]